METAQTSIARALAGELIEAPAALMRATTSATPIVPRVNVRVRPATNDDLPFIDALQKAHAREVGFLPRMALEGKVRLGQVLVAESDEPRASASGSGSGIGGAPTPLPHGRGSLGYLIAADRYFKRDEIGYVTQINVVPAYRRSLVAAALLQAQFDRSAYGCRLYCCWCAQDLKANEFWEAMGFVPIAFRTGSRTKGRDRTPRIHIFWQMRIRADDVTTPWWYPSQTGGGALREDRIVFPIPPGMGWRDVLPIVLPGAVAGDAADGGAGMGMGTGGAPAKRARPKRRKVIKTRIVRRPRGPRHRGGMWLASDMIDVVEPYAVWETVPDDDADTGDADATPGDGESVGEVGESGERAKVTIDPRLTAMARELRDRWSERPDLIVEPAPRYDVRRTLADEPAGLMPELTVPTERGALPAFPLAA